EVEFVLAAFFGRARGRVAVLGGVGKDGGAELLVHQNAGLRFRQSAGHDGLEGVVDDALGRGDLGRLRRRQRARPAAHLRLERAAVVERQNVQRLVVAHGHFDSPLLLRKRRMSALVELSCLRAGSVLLSSSGTICWASTLPSSTPHWSNELMFHTVPCTK